MLAEALSVEGFDVCEAVDGLDAVRQIDDLDHVDCVLTDVRMPGNIDGFGVARYARKRNQVVPVVLVSGFSAEHEKLNTILPPPAIFVGKPYSLSELVHIVGRLVHFTPT